MSPSGTLETARKMSPDFLCFVLWRITRNPQHLEVNHPLPWRHLSTWAPKLILHDALDPSTVLLALFYVKSIYLDTPSVFVPCKGLTPPPFQVKRVIVCALAIAHKWHNDTLGGRNEHWVEICERLRIRGVSLADMDSTERKILAHFDYNVLISDYEYRAWVQQVFGTIYADFRACIRLREKFTFP
ncbi:hypothetical protein HDU80_002193 [Chytriomyces hyalinus]|nr:hypothetical protein HDU80_002193 [Chytriomyces hyalinus]